LFFLFCFFFFFFFFFFAFLFPAMAFFARRTLGRALTVGLRGLPPVGGHWAPRPAPAAPYSTGLASLVKREIDQELPALQDRTAPTLPEGFRLEDKQGSAVITLKARFQDEDITVEASVPPKMEFDTPWEKLCIEFFVVVERKAGIIEFQCVTAEAGYDVQTLKVFEPSERKIALDDNAEAQFQRDWKYAGPMLEDLEEDLQDALGGFLADRGITEELAQFIQQYIKEQKEPGEYVRWLTALHRAVS